MATPSPIARLRLRCARVRSDSGASTVEYALMVALVALVIATAAIALGGGVGNVLTGAAATMSTPGGAQPGGGQPPGDGQPADGGQPPGGGGGSGGSNGKGAGWGGGVGGGKGHNK